MRDHSTLQGTAAEHGAREGAAWNIAAADTRSTRGTKPADDEDLKAYSKAQLTSGCASKKCRSGAVMEPRRTQRARRAAKPSLRPAKGTRADAERQLRAVKKEAGARL